MNQQHMDTSTKNRILITGTVLGAVSGFIAAYLLVQRAEKEGREVQFSAKEGVKLGALVFGLLRQVAQLGG